MAERVAECISAARPLHWEDFLWTLGALCELREVPFDGMLFVRQFPPPYSIEQLIAVLRALGIGVRDAPIAALRGPMTFPCVAFLRPESSDAVGMPRKAALIARCDGRHALAINSLSRGTLSVPLALLDEIFEPLLLRPAPAGAPTPARE